MLMYLRAMHQSRLAVASDVLLREPLDQTAGVGILNCFARPEQVRIEAAVMPSTLGYFKRSCR